MLDGANAGMQKALGPSGAGTTAIDAIKSLIDAYNVGPSDIYPPLCVAC